MLCAGDPERECLISCLEGVRLSYADFKKETEILAAAMIARGIERGDRVGIWSTNNFRWLVVLYAAARVGAMLVNINPGYRGHELSYVLNQSGVKLLFTIAGNRGVSYLGTLAELTPLARSGGSAINDLPGLEQIVLIPSVDVSGKKIEQKAVGSVVDFGHFVARNDLDFAALEARSAAVQFDDPVNIQYTSGTTGFPKGVTLSHHNLLNNGFFAARAMDLDRSSRFCIPMPFYHCGGMVSSALATLSVGGTIIIPAPYFEELTVMQAVQGERASHISGVPTMFISQLEHKSFKNYDYTSLKGGFMAGAPCPVQLMRRVASEMHVGEVVILYGLTEVSPLMTATNNGDTMEARATTVGRAIPGVEVKIIDTTSGELLPRGSQGEICCRGHGIMLGYWQNPEATADCIDSAGWLHSGDLGVMNAQGYLHITGRKKDMIIRGGENIYPREIEEVMLGHGAVAQAQVFGIPDARLGEEVAMWVAIKQNAGAAENVTAEELSAFLAERIAHFKVPRHMRFVSEFPMTVTGKIQKFAMRAAMIKELGLESAEAIETA
ncbi:MAG: AMP-binding protein [Cyanobacteria bacterium REEB67]|nr:AMP-binding protein [Cyanobacteria bacterium REEB67]